MGAYLPQLSDTILPPPALPPADGQVECGGEGEVDGEGGAEVAGGTLALTRTFLARFHMMLMASNSSKTVASNASKQVMIETNGNQLAHASCGYRG